MSARAVPADVLQQEVGRNPVVANPGNGVVGMTRGSCCPPVAHGPADPVFPGGEHKLNGSEVVLGDGALTVYVSEPAQANGAGVIVWHDIFGPNSGRTKLICDAYAAAGYVVFLPYLMTDFHAEPCAAAAAVATCCASRIAEDKHKWATVGPLVEDLLLPYVLEERQVASIAMACFCWGCYPMVHVLGLGLEQVKCAVGFHPSMSVFQLTGESREKAAKRIKAPVMFLAAWLDPNDIKAGGLVQNALKGKAFYDQCVFKTFDSMVHGWVNRGMFGASLDIVKRDYVKAMDSSLGYFDLHCGVERK